MTTIPKGLMTLALLSGPVIAHAQQYSLKEIPAPAGLVGFVLGSAINTSGVVAGSAYANIGYVDPHVFVYSKGVTTDLGDDDPSVTCGQGSGATAAGINEIGQIAATICATTEFPSAALLADGVYTPFAGTGIYQVPPFASSAAINAGGLIVGTLFSGVTSAGCSENGFHTFLYNSGAGKLEDLGTLLGCSSSGSAINDAGQIAGYYIDNGGQAHAYLYDNGNTTDLDPGGPATWAYGINANGEVTGTGNANGGDAFIYANGMIKDIGNLGGVGRSTGYAINAGGEIVGTSWTAAGAQHAFVYGNGSMLDLNSLISSAEAAKFTLISGVALNDNGQIVVQGYVNSDPSQKIVSFLLTPLTPAISPLVSGTSGANGWYVTATTLAWYVTGTPAPTQSGCGKVKVPNTTGSTYTCSASNSAGSAQQSITIKVDTVAPKVEIKKPVNNATYALKKAVLASYTCTDATSGVSSCAGTAADGASINTATPGPQTFSVVATDNAGNTTTKSVTYTVE